MSELRRLAAFTTDPSGGNPAGVWLGEQLPEAAEMRDIARRVGYSETAFLAPGGDASYKVRYFSPVAEVPFCGHATIAAGVVLGEKRGPGSYDFETAAGLVLVDVAGDEGHLEASLTSVEPSQRQVSPRVLEEALSCLGWDEADLRAALPPVVGFAGAWHLILVAATRQRLSHLDYDFDRLARLMVEEDLTTVQLLWQESPTLFHSRNPFPVGGVVEDPATGAAAAAFGGYLRSAGLVVPPAHITILQGQDMGRPSVIKVTIPRAGGIGVSGTAVDIPDD